MWDLPVPYRALFFILVLKILYMINPNSFTFSVNISR